MSQESEKCTFVVLCAHCGHGPTHALHYGTREEYGGHSYKAVPITQDAAPERDKESGEQVKYMVDRFLGWRLPENFNPDGGISFSRMRNEHTDFPAKNEPTGTNLFDANQATEMVLYMIRNAPKPSESTSLPQLVDELGFEVSTDDNPRDVLIRDSDSTEWTSGMAWARNSPETILTMLRDLWKYADHLSALSTLQEELESRKLARAAAMGEEMWLASSGTPAAALAMLKARAEGLQERVEKLEKELAQPAIPIDDFKMARQWILGAKCVCGKRKGWMHAFCEFDKEQK